MTPTLRVLQVSEPLPTPPTVTQEDRDRLRDLEAVERAALSQAFQKLKTEDQVTYLKGYNALPAGPLVTGPTQRQRNLRALLDWWDARPADRERIELSMRAHGGR